MTNRRFLLVVAGHQGGAGIPDHNDCRPQRL